MSKLQKILAMQEPSTQDIVTPHSDAQIGLPPSYALTRASTAEDLEWKR